MAFPIMVAASDRESPAPIVIWKPKKWDADGTPSEWETIIPEPLKKVFRLIHDAQVIHSPTGGLDKAIVAGREGVSLVWLDEKSQQWQHANIGTGLPQMRKPHQNPYWGAGSVATARVANDSVGYIASCEVSLVSERLFVSDSPRQPRHSMATSYRFTSSLLARVRTKSLAVKTGAGLSSMISVPSSMGSVSGSFFVFQTFLNPHTVTGTIHNVMCADLDGSGVDSIIVSCMGYREQ
jgi:hypothetical protein